LYPHQEQKNKSFGSTKNIANPAFVALFGHEKGGPTRPSPSINANLMATIWQGGKKEKKKEDQTLH